MVRKTIVAATLLLCGLSAAEKKERSLEVRAISHSVSQQTYQVTSPGHANTHCSGGTVTTGSTTSGTANCQTTSTPSTTSERAVVYVRQIVEADGMRYTITCTARWIWSGCTTLDDGDRFPAKIKGYSMSVTGHKGGNMGKEVRIKYRIVDMRPAARGTNDPH